jgi:hypothetical protein
MEKNLVVANRGDCPFNSGSPREKYAGNWRRQQADPVPWLAASSPASHNPLKGLSHEIFTVIFWLEWIYIGLKGYRFWFLNFKDVSLILDSNFKY